MRFCLLTSFLTIFALAACAPQPETLPVGDFSTPQSVSSAPATPTLIATRPPYPPGELVDYTAQSGDTLPALAARFNTTEDQIRAANPQIPQSATTMPPGFPMQIPIYYLPLWGTPFQSLPDSLFINGPAQVGFDLEAFIQSQPGWLKNFTEPTQEGRKNAADIILLVAKNFSVSPQLLAALLDYQSGAFSQPEPPADGYFLGYRSAAYRGLYLQLVWAANTLNNGYYGWRGGSLTEWKHPDGRLNRPDPWQNAASVALQYYFSQLLPTPTYDEAVGPQGFSALYRALYGDPWQIPPHLPVSLEQPPLALPFEPGVAWNFTGGPHTGWGKGEPLAAIDFAPAGVSGCATASQWALSMSPGTVVRSEADGLAVDMDNDGDERTGWVIFYLHLALSDRPALGQQVQTGTRLGHPSCEGGESTGTHIHLARKYNGEWMLAAGPLGFNLEGWLAHNGPRAYQGFLTRFSRTVVASEASEAKSLITKDK